MYKYYKISVIKVKLILAVIVLSFNISFSQNKGSNPKYRNLFLEAGYKKQEIQEKLICLKGQIVFILK